MRSTWDPRPHTTRDRYVARCDDTLWQKKHVTNRHHQMDTEVDIQRCIERALRDSGAIDQEALCVQPGRTVWALRVAVRVLDAAGNLQDACMLAALAALMAFRRPVAEVDAQGTLTLYAAADREPLPLSLHHLPVATTFASFSEVCIQMHTPVIHIVPLRMGSCWQWTPPRKRRSRRWGR